MDFTVRYANAETDDKIGEILYGLSAIKNVGEKAASNIIQERNENGKYEGFIDFLKRVDLRLVNKKCVENLIFSGAFDSIEPNRNKLFLNMERSTTYAQRYAVSEEARGQEGLFSNSGNSKVVNQDYIIQDYEDFPENEKYNREKAAIGFYITGHPLSVYEKEIESFIDLNFGEDPAELDFNRLKTVTMCGVINDAQIKISKRGNKFVVFNLVDFYGSGECIAFGKLFEMKESLFTNDSLVVVRGTPEENGDKIKLLVNEIYNIDTYLELFTKNMTIFLSEKETDVSNLYLIKEGS